MCTAVGAVSTAGGLLLAGALTSLSSWRWVLFLNVPLGLVILVLAPFVIEETARSLGRFDLAGALVSALGAASLVYGLAQAAERSWSDPVVVGCVLAGVALLVVFVGIERHAEQPIVVLRLFADRDRVCAYLGTLAIPGALIGTYFFLNQFFQKESGWGPLTAAAALVTLPVTMAVTAVFAARLTERIGAKQVMAIGAALLLSGNLWLTQLSATSGYWDAALPALVMLGAGMALCVLPPTVLATSGLRPGEVGAAAGVLNSLQSVGGSLGLAMLVTVSTHSEGMSAAFLTGSAFAAVALLAALCLQQAGHPQTLTAAGPGAAVEPAPPGPPQTADAVVRVRPGAAPPPAPPLSGTSLTQSAARNAMTATAEPSRKAEWVPAETAYWYAARVEASSFARLAASSWAPCSAAPSPTRSAITSWTRWLKIAPMIATPKELPSVRNSVIEEDATPMSAFPTLFCAISMTICIRKPMPAPSTAMERPEVRREVPVSIWASR